MEIQPLQRAELQNDSSRFSLKETTPRKEVDRLPYDEFTGSYGSEVLKSPQHSTVDMKSVSAEEPSENDSHSIRSYACLTQVPIKSEGQGSPDSTEFQFRGKIEPTEEENAQERYPKTSAYTMHGMTSPIDTAFCRQNSVMDTPSTPDSSHSSSSSASYFACNQSNTSVKKPVSHNPSHILPPCRVCGEKASGFHYGANTCEACKGFFRRSLKKPVIDYRCMGDNKCSVAVGRRNSCPACRYSKCLAIGMSKHAIKTGRYTHEKRTQDIVEIKKLQGQCEALKQDPGMSSEEIHAMMDPIINSHSEMFRKWHNLIESGNLLMKQKAYAEEHRLKKQIIGTSQPISNEEYMSFFRTTGIDVDERQMTMKYIAKHMEATVSRFVTFAKSIPGFCHLSLEDQASLIKMSRFEVWLIGAYKFMNSDLQVVCGPERSYHIDELMKLWDLEFIKSVFNFAKNMQRLGLSRQEDCLLKCVVLTFTDRCDLQNPEKVEEIQWKLLTCLRSLITQEGSSEHRLSQIMDRVVQLRDLSEWHVKLAKKLVLDMPVIQQHPLILELMSF